MPSLPPLPDIPEGLEHLLPVFVAEMVKDAARLAELSGRLTVGARGEFLADLAEHAHAMRGKAGLFGESLLYDLLTEVEASAQAGDAGALPLLVARVVERSGQLAVYGHEVSTGPA